MSSPAPVRDPNRYVSGGYAWFDRTTRAATLEICVPLGVAAAFLVEASWASGLSVPEGYGAWIPITATAPFLVTLAALLVAAALVATRRCLEPTVIQVGRDGVSLPGLIACPWTSLADVRVETWASSGSPRRLAFVPVDPAMDRRPIPDRIVWDVAMRLVFRRWLRGADATPAPFGVMDLTIGTVAFEDLLGITRAFVTVRDQATTPLPAESDGWSGLPFPPAARVAGTALWTAVLVFATGMTLYELLRPLRLVPNLIDPLPMLLLWAGGCGVSASLRAVRRERRLGGPWLAAAIAGLAGAAVGVAATLYFG